MQAGDVLDLLRGKIAAIDHVAGVVNQPMERSVDLLDQSATLARSAMSAWCARVGRWSTLLSAVIAARPGSRERHASTCARGELLHRSETDPVAAGHQVTLSVQPLRVIVAVKPLRVACKTGAIK